MPVDPKDLFAMLDDSGSQTAKQKCTSGAQKKNVPRLVAVDGVLTDEQRQWVAEYAETECKHWPDGRFTSRPK